MFGLPASFLVAIAVLVGARIVPYELDLLAQEVAPDGFPRTAIAVNGTHPGPIIVGVKGDDFRIQVNNLLSDPNMRMSSTIHWHGLRMPRAAFDDGPAFVTQCPIAPFFSYEYLVRTENQAGTFWYHSHLSSQYIDGLRGALILYDPRDPHRRLYDVDNSDTVLQLTDWYHESARKLGADWLAGRTPEPVPDSNLFNGFGRYRGGPEVPRPVVNVRKGKRYRFRLINMSAIVPFNFAVEGHSLTVIEVDGTNHHPLTVSSLSISAGQRYSVVLNANRPVSNYWIAYPSNFRETLTPGVNDNYNGTEAFAVLHYQGAPDAEPTTPQITPDDTNALKEYKLVPLNSPHPPTDQPLVINLKFFSSDRSNISTPGGGNKWLVNGVQYTSPKIPTLLQILSGGASENQTGSLPDDVIVLPIKRTIDLVISGNADHPFHLHGHSFQVIQSAQGPRNVINPPIRDTVDTNDGNATSTVGPVTIRFKTDNPGPWFLHCHKDWHLEGGLAVVFAEDPEGQRRTLHPNKAWRELCRIYDQLPDDEK